MDTIMEGASNVIMYVDDVLIHSATHEAHIVHIRHTIQRTHKAALAQNPQKCIFESTTVEYLGHTISSDGDRPGKDKTQAVKDITEPSWEKAIIVGIPSTATYRIRREVGNKKVKTVNMQKLKPRHCGDGDGPPEQDKEKPGCDTKGRRI
jgi:hypothetical protein